MSFNQSAQPQQYAIPPSKSGMAIAGLIVGIIALLTSFLPIINNFSAILGVLGLIFGIVGMVGCSRGKHSGKGLAIAAIVVNIVAFVVVLATQSMYSAALDEVSNELNSGNATVEEISQTTSDAATQDAADDASKYTIADEQLVDQGYGMYTITGTLTNNAGKALDYVQVEYILKDESGAQIGTGLANTNNLAQDGVWKFEAYCTSSSDVAPASFELSGVSGF